MRLGPLAGCVVATLCAAKGAAAAPGLWFELTRSSEARACPDASQLSRTVEALFGPQVVRIATNRSDASLHVAIAIDRAEKGYAAVLRVENEVWSERRIVDADTECRGLPEALAVAVVLLVEPDARLQRRPAPARDATEPSPRRAGPPIFLNAEAGGLLGTGLLGELGSPTFGGSLGATLTRGAAGLRLRGLGLLRPGRSFGDSSLQFDAWAVSFGPCWRLALPRGWGILPCAELTLGEQRAHASVAENDSDAAGWRGVTTGATLLVPLSGSVRATGSVGGVFRLHRQNYFIDGQSAEVQPRFAPFVGLGLELGFEIDDGK